MSATQDVAPALTARTFIASLVLQLRMHWSVLILLLGVVQPAAFLALIFLARRGHAVDPAAAAVGMALVGLWGTTVWQAGNVLRFERREGTLAAIATRPASFAAAVWGKNIGAILHASAFVIPTVAIAAALAGHPIPVRHPLAFAAAAIGVVLSAAVLGMLLGCLFLLSRSASRIAEALTYPIFILGGLVVPLTLLPGWLQPVSVVVSLRWGGDLLRAASTGAHQQGRDWLLFAATTLAYALVWRLLFARVLARARREGTLELF